MQRRLLAFRGHTGLLFEVAVRGTLGSLLRTSRTIQCIVVSRNVDPGRLPKRAHAPADTRHPHNHEVAKQCFQSPWRYWRSPRPVA